MTTATVFYVTFDQHHTAGALKGIVTTGTCAFGSDARVEQWRRGLDKRAASLGYTVANVRVSEMTVPEYIARNYPQ